MTHHRPITFTAGQIAPILAAALDCGRLTIPDAMLLLGISEDRVAKLREDGRMALADMAAANLDRAAEISAACDRHLAEQQALLRKYPVTDPVYNARMAEALAEMGVTIPDWAREGATP